ncbi:hypothetical protein KAX08_08125 [candidate division WOR-3 bacterium]|nr:hypothetical protein [candidate division WOR-3 bacterium]
MEKVIRRENSVEQQQFDKFIKQLIICFNRFHSDSSFELRYTVVPHDEKEKLFELANKIDGGLKEVVELLIGYIGSWGEEMTGASVMASYKRDLLKDLNPYFLKYGYYYNMDITKPYPKPSFICRFKGSKEINISSNLIEEGKNINIVYLERIPGYYYWEPVSPIYLLPTEEMIIFEDLILAEAKTCAKKIKSLKKTEKELTSKDFKSSLMWFTYKQWKEIAGLSLVKIIDRINKDLINSCEAEGIREAFDVFLLENEGDYLRILSGKLGGLSLGPIPYYCLGKIIDEAGESEAVMEILCFFAGKIEGREVEISEDNVNPIIKKLMNLDELTIRKYAEEMYRERFDRELVDGSLRDLKSKNFVEKQLTVQNMINGIIPMDSLAFESLEKGFINTGKIGNDDRVGWEQVIKTLKLEDIKSTDLVDKKTKGIIKTKALWMELVKLYPYLKMVKYEETENIEYLESYWMALQRGFVFTKYKEELDMDEFIKESDYIENKVKKYEEKLAYSKNLMESYVEDVKEAKDYISEQEEEVKYDIKKEVDSFAVYIEQAEQEIGQIQDKEQSDIIMWEEKFLARRKTKDQKIEEIEKLSAKKIEKLEEEIAECRKQIKFKESIEMDLLIDDRTLERKRELLEKEALIKEEQKDIEKYEEIIAGLEGKIGESYDGGNSFSDALKEKDMD